MAKIKSFEELKELRATVKSKVDLKERVDNLEELIEVRVAMATCGIASGAKEVMNHISEECAKKGIKNVIVKQTGCMGYCYAEPTIEVILPGKEGIVFGDVDVKKSDKIIDEYIVKGELVDGVIPRTHRTID